MVGKSFAGISFIKSVYQTYTSGNSLTDLIQEKNMDEIVTIMFLLLGTARLNVVI